MVAPAIPLLAAAGAALMLSGGKKKKRGPKSGQKCDSAISPPNGFSCEEGFLQEAAVDETDLDSDADLSKDESGDFDTDEEDVAPADGEDHGDAADEPEAAPDPVKTCEEFMLAVHVIPEHEDELPINEIAVEEAVLPAMRATASGIAESLGLPLDIEATGPVLVVAGLKALIPVCEWKYALGEGFTYSNGTSVVSDEAKDVVYGLIELSVSVIEEMNTPEPQVAELQPQG